MRNNLTAIPVFYTERMLAETASFNPNAGNPHQVLATWQQRLSSSVHTVQPIEQIDLHVAHGIEHITIDAFSETIIATCVTTDWRPHSPAWRRDS